MLSPAPSAAAEPSTNLALADFVPHGIVPSASMGTRAFSYPLGVRLAYLAYVLRLTPNFVSILSFLVGIAAAVMAGLIEDVWYGGLVLLVGTQLAYILDCADGVLARGTGSTTAFGAILDKTLDGIAMLCIPGILCLQAPARHEMLLTWVGPMILFTSVPNIALALVIWLKGYVDHGGAKQYQDERAHTPFWWAARIVAFCLDTPVFRLLMAVAWMTSTFVEFMIGYGVFATIALVIYLFKSHRELAASGRGPLDEVYGPGDGQPLPPPCRSSSPFCCPSCPCFVSGAVTGRTDGGG